MPKHKIIPQMFDVRPVDHTGDLDWKKIHSVGEGDADNWREEQRLFQLQEQARLFEQQQKARREAQESLKLAVQRREVALREERGREKEADRLRREEIIRNQALRRQEEIKKIAGDNLRYHLAYEAAVKSEREKLAKEHEEWLKEEARLEALSKKDGIAEEEKEKITEPARIVTSAEDVSFVKSKKKKKRTKKTGAYDDIYDFYWRDIFFPRRFPFQFDLRRSLVTFAVTALVISFGVGGVSYASKGFGLKGKVMGASQNGMANLASAVSDLSSQNFAAGADPQTLSGGPATTNAFSFGITTNGAGRTLRVVSRTVQAAATNTVSVQLDSLGDENALGFDLGFDPAILHYLSGALGAGAAGAALNLNTNQLGAGRLGVAVALLPGGSFAAGTRDIFKADFAVTASATGATSVVLGDGPVPAEFADALANALTVNYAPAALAISPFPPRLRAARSETNVTVAWPVVASNFVLQVNSAGVTTNAWSNSVASPAVQGDDNVLTVTNPAGQQFFRLYQP